MRKWIISLLAVIILAVSLAGCGGTTEQEAEKGPDSVVVSVPKDLDIKSEFDFKYTHNMAVSDFSGKGYIREGVCTTGKLPNGNTIIWYSDDDNYGYDDCLFIYVEDDVDDDIPGEVIQYANKISDENAISYDAFLETYRK